MIELEIWEKRLGPELVAGAAGWVTDIGATGAVGPRFDCGASGGGTYWEAEKGIAVGPGAEITVVGASEDGGP